MIWGEITVQLWANLEVQAHPWNQPPLEGIEAIHHNRPFCTEGTAGIGGAKVAATDLAQIDPGKTGKQQSEGDGT
jgi:hypothetical protein